MAIIQLIRLKVAVMVGLSAFAGACLYSPRITSAHWYAAAASIWLCAGCSALNQFQEKDEDALMLRTRKRPLPAKTLDTSEVIGFSFIFFSLALCFMLLTEKSAVLYTGLFTVIGYNFIYTPMKKKTPLALLAGSVTGSLPPYIGYCAAGGNPLDTNILLVCTVLYIWQTPHFAMLTEKYAADYKAAGFKTISETYGRDKSRLFVNVWMAAYVCALILLPAADVYTHFPAAGAHIVLCLFTAFILIFYRHRSEQRFRALNISAVFFFLLLITDKVFL
jgi:protoheme IX farnesyltransferase